MFSSGGVGNVGSRKASPSHDKDLSDGECGLTLCIVMCTCEIKLIGFIFEIPLFFLQYSSAVLLNFASLFYISWFFVSPTRQDQWSAAVSGGQQEQTRGHAEGGRGT